ncbi:MAG: putative stress-responsive transcriptional regulator [Candidatus Doudnabacteria bacterium Gr01-1014_77]|uniref:Putative stress-responsive transcriptional regulator n=1 Tax=Candidatus Doudnabacteria bacterium Gr01-1014_77 TaxID=2017133 RepID=A0A554JBL6_9BACT|nr:MAG: putative stress-responsive transcriptional regulator [Candidatus Doudnabacteria bacterium Gr01-1014_77]
MSDIKNLRRSKEHRIIAGVCGGIAEYFETDPVLVRLIFLAITLVAGSGIVLYLLLIVVIPEKGERTSIVEKEFGRLKEDLNREEMPKNKHDDHYNHTRGVFGFFLIIIGLMVLLDNMFPELQVSSFWPMILIFLGLAIMMGKHRHH